MRRASGAPKSWSEFIHFLALSSLFLLAGCGSSGSATGSSVTATPALESLVCASTSFTGAATVSCTVTLTTPAADGGFVASLSSSNASVTVPATVTIRSGASSAEFTANVMAVTTAQSATLTASGGGVSETSTLELNAAAAAFSLSTSSVSFGSENLNSGATQTVTLTSTGAIPVTLNSDAVTGAGFSVSGPVLPTTLNANQTATFTVAFDPTTAGAASGTLSIVSTATTGGTAVVSLSGTGVTPAGLSGLSCASATLAAGAQTDACTVTLTAAASSSITVNLASSNSNVTAPASVTVPAGSNSAAFTASAAQVTTAQTATLTASAGGVSATFAIQLTAATTVLSVNATSVGFGDITVGQSATQTVMATATGTLPVTITAVAVTGSEFAGSGITPPETLQPDQEATLSLVFAPTATGSVTGSVAITSNGGSTTIPLSGTGEAATAYEVQLSWTAADSPADPAVGYDIYRAPVGTTNFTLLNSTTATSYTDISVQDGQSYVYMIESVDAEGNESVPSNSYTATIP